MQKIRSAGIVVILLLALPLVCFGQEGAFKPGSEPDGFRGNKWEKDIKEFTNMKRISFGNKRYPRTSVYIKENDDLVIEGIEFKEIRYGFLEDKKFNSVDAFTKSEMDLQVWNKFKDIIIEKYGEDYLKEDNLSDEIYTWKGEVSTVIMRFSKAYKSFSLTLQHKFPDISDMQPQITE